MIVEDLNHTWHWYSYFIVIVKRTYIRVDHPHYEGVHQTWKGLMFLQTNFLPTKRLSSTSSNLLDRRSLMKEVHSHKTRSLIYVYFVNGLHFFFSFSSLSINMDLIFHWADRDYLICRIQPIGQLLSQTRRQSLPKLTAVAKFRYTIFRNVKKVNTETSSENEADMGFGLFD